MLIGGLQKTTFIDFPKKIAAIVFTLGCNFRCPYCHNPELVKEYSKIISEESILEFLKTRINKLDGVVVTGGEPCLQKDLPNFLKKLKDMNFLVKLDTNGSKSEMLKLVVNEGLVDYVAMDIKAPLLKYEDVVNSSFDVAEIGKSVQFLKNSNIDYEFRTTVVDKLLQVQDFYEIGKLVEGAKKYYLQKYNYSKILDENFKDAKTFDEKTFNIARDILQEYNVNEICIR